MLDSEQIKRIQPKLKTVQIIAAALIGGAFTFTVAMSLLVDWEHLNSEAKMLTMMGAGTGLLVFVLSIFAPRVFSGQSAKQKADTSSAGDSAVDAAVPMMMTETLIRYTLLESGIFLNLMVMILEPHVASISVAGMGLFLMLALFPTSSRLLSGVEDRALNVRN